MARWESCTQNVARVGYGYGLIAADPLLAPSRSLALRGSRGLVADDHDASPDIFERKVT
jgi:hypothetical protein